MGELSWSEKESGKRMVCKSVCGGATVGLSEMQRFPTQAEFVVLHNNLVKIQTHFQWNSPPVRYDVFHMVMYDLWLHHHTINNDSKCSSVFVDQCPKPAPGSKLQLQLMLNRAQLADDRRKLNSSGVGSAIYKFECHDAPVLCVQLEFPSIVSCIEQITNCTKGKKITLFLDYDRPLSLIVDNPYRAYMSDKVGNDGTCVLDRMLNLRETLTEMQLNLSLLQDLDLFSIQENKDKKDAEFNERFKHRPPKALDEDETKFLDSYEACRKEYERKVEDEEAQQLRSFQVKS